MVRRILVALAGALFLAAAPAWARPSGIDITITEAGQGIRVAYDLPAPVTTLALGGDERPPAGTSIRVEDNGLNYEDGQIRGRVPFRHATLVLEPDSREVDSRYPLLSSIAGRGFVLYVPYILPPPGPLHARVSLGNGRYRTLSREEAADGYVVVGMSPVDKGAFDFLASTTASAALQAELSGRAAALLDFYAGRLHHRLTRSPTLIVSVVDEPADKKHRFFRGDVTPNGVVLLRFHGTGDQIADPNSVRQFTSFLAHELFHLWNGRQGDHPMSEAWLHEGSAEYFGWLASATLWPDEVSLDQNLLNALHICGAFLGNGALSTVPADQENGMRYPCGAVAQWIVDVGARGASDGSHDGFGLWARLLAQGRQNGGYTLAQFRTAARELAPDTSPLLDMLIDVGMRWDALAPVLTRAGASIHAGPPSVNAIYFAATRPIVLSMCGDFMGAGYDREGVYFDSGPCGFAGTFTHLVRVESVDPTANPQAFLALVEQACEKQESLALILNSEGTKSERSIRCTKTVEQPLPDFRIERALPNPPARSGP